MNIIITARLQIYSLIALLLLPMHGFSEDWGQIRGKWQEKESEYQTARQKILEKTPPELVYSYQEQLDQLDSEDWNLLVQRKRDQMSSEGQKIVTAVDQGMDQWLQQNQQFHQLTDQQIVEKHADFMEAVRGDWYQYLQKISKDQFDEDTKKFHEIDQHYRQWKKDRNSIGNVDPSAQKNRLYGFSNFFNGIKSYI